MSKQSSGVATRGIGFELERLRRAAELNLQTVADALGVSISTISRLENGKRDPTVEEVASILTVLGVVGAERVRLLDQARGGSGLGLVEGSSPTVQSRTYLNFEIRATTITNFELMLVPGLAQTAEYAFAIITALMLDREEPDIEARVARRLARQTILARRTPPQVNLIIAETALRLPVGGPEVMGGQLRHLIDLSRRRNITTRVVPADAGAHPGIQGQFVILEYEADPTVIFIEDRATGLFLDSRRQVDSYRVALAKLMDSALDESDSLDLVASIAHDFDGQE